MLDPLRRILEMIRFSHTLFALPFALLAAVMAWTTPGASSPAPAFRWQDLLGILLCMVFARSAAMAFNRLADRHYDARNPRTASRHLPAGHLSPRTVVLFTVACCTGFCLATLVFWPNRLPVLLALPVLGVLLAYSYTKRFTALSHAWLGLSLMLAPVGAWIALRGQLLERDPADIWPALWLGAAVLTWVAGFDIIYACQDADFDRKARLHSIPARIGIPAALRVAAGCHLLTVVILATLPSLFPRVGLDLPYLVGTAAVALLLLYEHWLVRPDDLTRVNVAFFQVNVVISLGLCVVGTADMLLG